MKKWKMPPWMEPYRAMITNTGGNRVEDLVNGRTDSRVNLPLWVLETCARSQTGLLEQLHEARALTPPAPADGGG